MPLDDFQEPDEPTAEEEREAVLAGRAGSRITTGTLWPTPSDHSLMWWLAGEIIADSDDSEKPENVDPRVWCAAEFPNLHAAWVERIEEYIKHGLCSNTQVSNAARSGQKQ